MKRYIPFMCALLFIVVALWSGYVRWSDSRPHPSEPSAVKGKGVRIELAGALCRGGEGADYTVVYYPAIKQYGVLKMLFGDHGRLGTIEWGEYTNVNDAYNSIAEQPECRVGGAE